MAEIPLTRWERFTGSLAKRIVVVASWVNATAVLSLCVETARLYRERYPDA